MNKRYCLAVAVLVIFFAESSCESTPAVPDELMGIWRTQSLAHKDTFFELEKGQISFGTATGEVLHHAITKVNRKKDPREGWTLYKIYYLNESAQSYEFSFYYQPAGQGKVFLKNKLSEVWSRDPS